MNDSKLKSFPWLLFSRLPFIRSLMIISAVTVLASLMGLAGTPAAPQPLAGQKANDVADRVAALPSVSIDADNSEHPPMSVTRARVKTLTGDEYRELLAVGGVVADHYVSFPETRVSNDTNKTVTSFGYILTNKRFPDDHWATIIHQTIAPYAKFVNPSSGWVGVPRAGVADAGKAAWSSVGMWLPGLPTDFSIYVAGVYYADGSSWLATH